MIKRLLVIAVLSIAVSGCFMVPLAFIGPATSGFSTASLIQSGVTTGANYVVRKSTGKTISEHVTQSLKAGVISQSYAPEDGLGEKLKKSYDPKINLAKDVESMIFIANESSMIILLLQNHCYPK